uniref:SKP1 component POZ domain-containing protein n=1 Tax=Anopheles atroparvus TaxID=41427 RepID=A0A182INR3_ANOAO
MEQISLKSKDGVIIHVESSVLKQSKVLNAKMEAMKAENNTDFIIPVQDVNALYLSILVKWMERPIKKDSDNQNSENSEIPNNQEQEVPTRNPKKKRDDWDVQFFRAHRRQAFRLMAAANRLGVENFDQTFGRLLHMWIREKTPEQVYDLVCLGLREETVNFESPDSVFSCDMSEDCETTNQAQHSTNHY